MRNSPYENLLFKLDQVNELSPLTFAAIDRQTRLRNVASQARAPPFRRGYAEYHTAQVVSRDVGFLLALPAVAIILARSLDDAHSPSNGSGLNGLRRFENRCVLQCHCDASQ
jgi:hypothetical protein